MFKKLLGEPNAYAANRVTTTVLTDQQRIADTFDELKLIPTKISVRDAVLLGN